MAVVAEFYPSRRDPVLGVWAHRQALAARDAGAGCASSCCTVSCHRGPPWRPGRAARGRALAGLVREPRTQVRDGLPVTYVPYVSPPRERSYASWGAWAAPALGLALRSLARSFPFELIHAHNAVPAGDAVRRARLGRPLVVSVHGGDVLYTAGQAPAGASAVARALGAASSCSPTARASPSSRGRTAPARRAWCTSAPIYPPPDTARGVTLATARDGRGRHVRSGYRRRTH